MSNEASFARRGFLRGLLSLPLIGGGVALIGAPTAAAVPVTEEFLWRYRGFLLGEAAEALVEIDEIRNRHWFAPQARRLMLEEQGDYREMDRYPDLATMVRSAKPSTRAAVVLGAAGATVSVPRAMQRLKGSS